MSTAGIKTPTYLVDENKSGQIKEDYVLVFRFTQAFQNLSSFLKSTIDDCVFKHEKPSIIGLKIILSFLWIGGWRIVRDIFALSPTLLCDPIYLVFSFLLLSCCDIPFQNARRKRIENRV